MHDDSMAPRLVTLEDWIVDVTCRTASDEDTSPHTVSSRKRAIALNHTERATVRMKRRVRMNEKYNDSAATVLAQQVVP